MKNLAIMICILLFGISNINLTANPQMDNKIEVCDEVDISKIASILGWNESQIETESLVSSSNQKNGVCRYVHGDEDLVILVKLKNRNRIKGGSVKVFGTVADGSADGGKKHTYEMKKQIGQYEVELNYGTEKNVDDAHMLMEKIALLVNQL